MTQFRILSLLAILLANTTSSINAAPATEGNFLTTESAAPTADDDDDDNDDEEDEGDSN